MDTTTLAPPPYQVGPDTFVIPELFPAGPDAYVPVNSMVIAGPEPVIVDTGTALNESGGSRPSVASSTSPTCAGSTSPTTTTTTWATSPRCSS